MGETEKALDVRQNDLTALSEGMEAASRARALEKVLSHYNRMGEDIDVLSRTVARQSETIAGLEKRLTALETKPPKSESANNSTPENRAGASDDSAKRTETRHRRRFFAPRF